MSKIHKSSTAKQHFLVFYEHWPTNCGSKFVFQHTPKLISCSRNEAFLKDKKNDDKSDIFIIKFFIRLIYNDIL